MIGKMRNRVTIQKPTYTGNGKGGHTISWSNVATLWAKMEPIREGQEFFTDQLVHRTFFRITFRYDSSYSLASDYRILKGSRELYFKSFVLVDEEIRFYEVIAEEGTGVQS